MPICTFSQFNPSTISLSETSNIELTCIGSNIGNIDLTSEDVTLSSSNVVLSDNIVKERIENGYKYTFTVTGTDTNGSTTLTLPSGKFIDEYGNGNDAIVSSLILVKNLVNITYISYGGSIAENEITLNNLVTNGNFEDGTNGWSTSSTSVNNQVGGTINNNILYIDDTSETTGYWTYQPIDFISGYTYYVASKIGLTSYTSGNLSMAIRNTSGGWSESISLNEITDSSKRFSFKTVADDTYYSYQIGIGSTGVASGSFSENMIIDLTSAYGIGNEPTKEWLDQNISYFDGTVAIYNEDKTINYNIGTLPIPTREGYTFSGWYTGENGTGTKITESTVLTQDAIYYAHWVADTYTVNFDGNMFTMTSYTADGLTFTYDINNSYLTINGTPTTNTYVFSYSMDMSFTEGDTYKLTEQYISGTYEYSGSSGGSSLTIDVVDSSYANVSTRNNLSPYIVTSTAGTINRTLTINSAGASEGAGFKFRMYFDSPADTVFTNYKIKVNLTKNDKSTVTFNEAYGTMPTPKRAGYTFSGWYTGENGTGTKIDSDTLVSITNDHTLYAKWTQKDYTATFDGNMFSTMNSRTINGLTLTYDYANSYLTINGTPTSTWVMLNYFMGLTFTEGDKYTLKLTYDSGSIANAGTGGGSLGVDVKNSSKSNVSTRNYTNRSYITSGSSSSTLTINSAGASEGAGFAYFLWFATPADWTFTDYKIKVNFTKNETKTVTFASAYGTMPTPKRAGYAFKGWYTGENGTGTNITSTSLVSSASNHTLYAKWSYNIVYVKFKTNGGTLTTETSQTNSSTGVTTTYTWGTDSNGYITRSTNGGTATNNFVSYRYGVTSIDLPDYNYSKYLKITRTGYNAKSGAEWICESGCSTANKTYSQTALTLSSSNDLCDATNGNCTLVLKVNWIDNVKPTGNVDISSSGTTVTANVTASDVSGIKEYGYLITTDSTCPTSGYVATTNSTYNFTVSSTGTYYICVKVTDNAENYTILSNSIYYIIKTAADLVSKANPSTLSYADATDSQKGEMWTFAHDATTQTSATTDYRYIGSSPNNYITFNDEVWRIIGVFDGRIKIIRNDTLGNMYWDYKKSGVGSSTTSYGSNDWTDSQLMYMLNPTSYTLKTGYSLTDGKIYDGSSNIIYQLGCKPASIAARATSYSCTSNTWSLNSTALSQISEATYYLGGSSSYSGHSAETYYAFERGTTVYSGRPTSWSGLVGLMYPSDYAYAFANGVDDKCYTDTYNCNTSTPSSSWLYKSLTYQWTVSPFSGSARFVFCVRSPGNVSYIGANLSYGVRPVVYLRSDIKLQGSGTSSEPYEIIA